MTMNIENSHIHSHSICILRYRRSTSGYTGDEKYPIWRFLTPIQLSTSVLKFLCVRPLIPNWVFIQIRIFSLYFFHIGKKYITLTHINVLVTCRTQIGPGVPICRIQIGSSCTCRSVSTKLEIHIRFTNLVNYCKLHLYHHSSPTL